MSTMVRVFKKTFDRVMKAQPYVTGHTTMICEPPITFYWNTEAAEGEDRSFGQNAFAKIVRDYEIVGRPPAGKSGAVKIKDKLAYYLRQDMLK